MKRFTTGVLAVALAVAAIITFTTVMTVSAQSDDPDWRLPATGLTVSAGDDPGEMVITWDAHTQTTKTLLNYRVAWTPEGEGFKSANRTNWNVYTTSTQHTVTGLDAGATYQVKVRTRYEGNQGSRWTEVVTGQSAAPPAVPTNSAATGQPTITGTAEVGETLTAGTSAISDDNGLTNVAFSHQWVRNVDGADTDITDATGSTYVVTNADIDKAIKVRLNFTDDDGYSETITSSATASVPVPAPVIVPPKEPEFARASHNVLVSNTGQPPADFTTNAVDHGQAFTTGSDTAGYTLNAIDIGYNDSSNTAFSASIWSTYALDKAPNTVLYSLTPPATFSPGNLTFTAPPNTTLTTGTTYIIMLALEDVGGATVKRTATVNPDEDAGAAAGWSIANNYIFAISGGWGQNGAFGPLLVAVKGTVYAGSNDATLSALTVNDGTNDLTLTPAFVSSTYAYEADVGNAVTTVTLSDTLNDDTAEITGVTLGGTAIADTDLTDGITVPSLLVGDNEIVVTVTAEDASTQTYTVTVTRAAAATPTVSISANKTTAVFKEDTITYTLTRTGSTAAALPVSVTFTQTKNFLATTALSRTVTIAAGQSTKTFNVTGSSFQLFAAGTAVEGGTLTATVQDGTDYDLGTPSSVDVAIVIGATVRFDMASYTVGEADGTLSFAIIARTGAGAPQPSSATGSINVLAEDRSASNAVDFAFTDGAENFQPSEFLADGGVWQAESTYNVSITNDDLDEDDETFILAIERGLAFLSYSLVDASGNSCGSKCTVTATIVDDDTAGVTVSKSAVTVTEQDTTGDTYTVVLDSQPTANVTITIGGQTAADITAAPTPLTFTTTNWGTPQTVTVTAGNDTDTVTDTHSLTHSATSSDTDYSGIPIANVGVTVNDNDSTIPALSFDNINITVDEDGSQAALSVELSQASTVTVTVDYATSDNTAEAGDDYTDTSGTLTFAPGETVKAIIVPILDDAIYEPLERFNVTLSNPTGATLPTFPGAQVNIAVDESPPTASIANVTVGEGAGTMTLTLNLSHESSRSTPYRTQTSYIGGTATQGADYVNFLSGGEARITVPAGDTQASLDITITDDTAAESSETITIRWDNDPTGGNNGDATPATINFTGTITDNDSADDSATGKPGITGAAQVGMTLTAGTANIMDSDGLTTPGYTYQWLRAGSDISGATSSTYTLTSSDYGETIQVKVEFTDDANNTESLTSDETVPVAPVAATCPTDTGTVWCATLTVGHTLDDDGDPSGSGFEARSGRTAFGSLSGTTFTHLGVNYTITSVWGGGLQDLVLSTTPHLPLDGAGLTMHVQTYGGELDAPLADASFNSDHWFFRSALYVAPEGDLSDVPLLRGQFSRGTRVGHPPDLGTKVMVRLSVNLTVPSAPSDLNARAVGDNRINLTWDAPSSNGGSVITGYKIEVSNNGRTNWTTRVANTGSSNRTHSHTGLSAGDIRHYRVSAINASGTGPHSNVDSATTGLPTVSIANATTTEGGDIVFIITISPTIDGFHRIGYGTGIEDLPPGSRGARKDDDYIAHHPAGNIIQIGYGLASVELIFTTVDDELVEGTEIFEIGLYPSDDEGRYFSYGKRTAIATIRDDENGGQAYQDSVRGDTSTNQFISPGGSVTNRIETVNDADWYRTNLTKDHCYQIKVEGSSADETLTLQYPALRGVYRSDGTLITGTNENAGGLGTTAISNVKLDTTATYYIAAGLYRFENGGTFRMSLTDLGTTDTSCGAAKAGAIAPLQISVADASKREWPNPQAYLIFDVTLDRDADEEVRVDYTTVDGTAVAGQDYESQSGTLVFGIGVDSKRIWVPILFDREDEETETMTLLLSNDRGAEISTPRATGFIEDYSSRR